MWEKFLRRTYPNNFDLPTEEKNVENPYFELRMYMSDIVYIYL